METVSFVITVYNKAAYLPGVIQALKEQQGDFAREFVFINDGSTDRSWEIVTQETADLENVVLIDQDNAGVSRATNRAVRAASGTFIKLVDSDDLLAPFCTELLLKTLKETETDFVFAISGEHDSRPAFEIPDNPDVIVFEDPLYSTLDRGFARVSHCLFRKSIFVQAEGCDERLFSQDHSLFLRLSALGRLAQVRHVVCSAPRDEPGRIMNNSLQVMHDATKAIAYLLADGRVITHRNRKLAQRKILSRLKRWSRKNEPSPLFSPIFLFYCLDRIGVRLSPDRLLGLCSRLIQNASIRS